jgi:hypothetical protein
MPKERATKVQDVSSEWGQPAWVYSDGSVRGERGKMLKALAGRVPFTHERARALAPLALAGRMERKRAVMLAAANEAVENPAWRKEHGTEAWLAAVSQTAYLKATTPDDPKAIDAARFLLQETGLAEAKQALAPSEAAGSALLGLLELAAPLIAARVQQQRADVVDAEVHSDEADSEE